MRTKFSEWFIIKLRHEVAQAEGGQRKLVAEQYAVSATSFTDAEVKITKSVKPHIGEDYKVLNIDPAPFREIFFTDADKDDKYYKAKVQFTVFDEKTEKEKKSNIYYLVQAANIEQARKNIVTILDNIIDYEIAALTETKILDCFEYIP